VAPVITPGKSVQEKESSESEVGLLHRILEFNDVWLPDRMT
jgi:hypothetical protein